MQVTIRRNEQLIVSPTQSGQEGDDEPPDPNPCLCGYRLETVLKDFYAVGDGKAIYCKSLL